MKYKQWKQAPCDLSAVKTMKGEGISPLLASVLCARGLYTIEKANEFLSSDEELMGDPFLLRDMDKAVARVRKAISAREHIAVFGDYDVDGITSTCLMTHWLREQDCDVWYYIPDRIEEGYGLSEAVSCLQTRASPWSSRWTAALPRWRKWNTPRAWAWIS
jgi:single-stranded-DNA-specific exonuclease